MLDMFEVLDEVVSENVDFIGVAMNLLSERDTPYHSINTFVKVIFGYMWAVKVHLKYITVHLKHSFEVSYQKIAFLDVDRTGTPDNFFVQSGCDASGQQLSLDSSTLPETVQNQPKMNLNHLRLNHIIMRNVESRGKLKWFDMVHQPHKYLLLHPIIILDVFRTIVFAGGPIELHFVQPPPINHQLLTLFIERQSVWIF